MPWVDEMRLDDSEALRALDSRDSLRSLASAGAQVRRAIVSAQEAGVASAAGGERPRSVLVAALGGSALVCDVLDLLAEPGSPVPVTTRRSAPLPGWVGPLDLVIAVSQSGRAAGPLALAAEAARRGASLLTAGAWVVNQLVRHQPDEVDSLLDLGIRLRAAQGTLGAADLRLSLIHI